MESMEHKLAKQFAAMMLQGRTECHFRPGHRPDACSEDLSEFAEVECKKTKQGRECIIGIYPSTCKKENDKVLCKPIKYTRLLFDKNMQAASKLDTILHQS